MIIKRELTVSVVEAARQRIRNIFANGLPVYLSFSGGKDSLVLADITMKLGQAGEIDLRLLRVEFIDEEAIFPCVERVVNDWRARFMMAGARFDWYCLEVRHFSCLNRLENDESFICFDSRCPEKWIRKPPSFAIRSHPLHVPRRHSYQEFLGKLSDGLHMTGLRAYESVQRRLAIARQGRKSRDKDIKLRTTIEPIYDMHDDDVWFYLAENHIGIPDAYMHLYQTGTSRRSLRISQFFSIDTAYSLARMSEFYPDLMERILLREPSAYIVSLYWDSEMFRRRSTNRRAAEANEPVVDYRAKVLVMLNDIEANFPTKKTRQIAEWYRGAILRNAFDGKEWRTLYEGLKAGDPKKRTLRGTIQASRLREAQQHVPGHSTAIM